MTLHFDIPFNLLAGELVARRETQLLGSPFDYAGRVLVGFPLDLPDPDEEDFLKAAARFLWQAIRASRGPSLVLFQSWTALRQTHELMAPHAGRLGGLHLCGAEAEILGATGRHLCRDPVHDRRLSARDP